MDCTTCKTTTDHYWHEKGMAFIASSKHKKLPKKKSAKIKSMLFEQLPPWDMKSRIGSMQKMGIDTTRELAILKKSLQRV